MLLLKSTRALAAKYGWKTALRILRGWILKDLSDILDKKLFINRMLSRAITENSEVLRWNINLKPLGIPKKLEIYLPPNDSGLSYDIIAYGLREPLHTKCLYDVIKEYNIRRILDIGSNVGYFPMIELIAGASSIISVEPIPETFKYLKLNLERFGGRCTLINAAVGTNSGFTKIYVPYDINNKPILNWATLNLDLLLKLPKVKEIKEYNTQLISFTELLAKYRPNLIRMDIEGYEWFLLSNINNIPEDVLVIDFEIHEGTLKLVKKAFANLIENGFRDALVIINPNEFPLLIRVASRFLGLERVLSDYICGVVIPAELFSIYPYKHPINNVKLNDIISKIESFMRVTGLVQIICVR